MNAKDAGMFGKKRDKRMSKAEILVVLIIGLIILAVAITGACIERAIEKKEWNKGYCRQHASPWHCYDMDSQGGRMYSCKQGCNIEVSYGVDK